MVDLPVELWMTIAHFIGYPEITQYITVHRIFLEYALDEKYREARFYQSRAIDMFEEVARLQRPEMASRAKVMKLWPHAIADALSGKRLIHPDNSWAEKPSLQHRALNFLRRGFMRKSGSSDSIEKSRVVGVPETLEERASTLVSAIQNLTKLQEIHISWAHENLYTAWGSDFDQIILSFVPSVLTNLRILVIDAKFTVMQRDHLSLFSTARIEELTVVKFSTEDPGQDSLVNFINYFTETLRCLTLDVLPQVDHSSMHERLGPFPQLRRLSLYITLQHQYLANPSAFGTFLSSQPRLAYLRLREWHHMGGGSRYWGLDHYRYEECFRDVTLRNLQELSLGLYITEGSGGIWGSRKRIAPIFNHLCPNITTFTFEGTQLTAAEAMELLCLLPSEQLTSLSASIRTFTPSVLQSLVVRCRSLEHLKVDVDYFGCVERQNSWDPDDSENLLKAIPKQRDKIPEFYCTWPLRRLDLVGSDLAQGRLPYWRVMDAIAEVVPSLYNSPGRLVGRSIGRLRRR